MMIVRQNEEENDRLRGHTKEEGEEKFWCFFIEVKEERTPKFFRDLTFFRKKSVTLCV
jgi:hypothetical protein